MHEYFKLGMQAYGGKQSRIAGFFFHVCFAGFMTLSFAWLGFSYREPRVVRVHILQSDLKIRSVAIVLGYRPLNYIEILRRKHSIVILSTYFISCILYEQDAAKTSPSKTLQIDQELNSEEYRVKMATLTS